MRRLIFTLAAAAAFTSAPAMAATFIPGTTNFSVVGDIFNGPIAADFKNSGTGTGTFTDIFQFTIPQTGVGSGSITTGATIAASSNDTDLISVFVNGVAATKTTNGLSETFSLSGVPILAGVQNQIVVTYLSRGLFSYGGNATFNPTAVPEAGTWAMMLLGLGGIAFALRRRQKAATLASPARATIKFA